MDIEGLRLAGQLEAPEAPMVDSRQPADGRRAGQYPGAQMLVQALDATGGVHRVADGAVLEVIERTDRTEHQLADVQADAGGQPAAAGHLERRQNRLNVQCGPACPQPLREVRALDRPQRQRRITHDVGHHAAVGADGRQQGRVVAVHQLAQLAGRQVFCQRRVASGVADQTYRLLLGGCRAGRRIGAGSRDLTHDVGRQIVAKLGRHLRPLAAAVAGTQGQRAQQRDHDLRQPGRQWQPQMEVTEGSQHRHAGAAGQPQRQGAGGWRAQGHERAGQPQRGEQQAGSHGERRGRHQKLVPQRIQVRRRGNLDPRQIEPVGAADGGQEAVGLVRKIRLDVADEYRPAGQLGRLAQQDIGRRHDAHTARRPVEIEHPFLRAARELTGCPLHGRCRCADRTIDVAGLHPQRGGRQRGQARRRRVLDPDRIHARRGLGQHEGRHRRRGIGKGTVRSVQGVDLQLRVGSGTGQGLHLALHLPEQHHVAGLGDGGGQRRIAITQACPGEEHVDRNHAGPARGCAPDQLGVNTPRPVGKARRQPKTRCRRTVDGEDHRFGRLRQRTATGKQPRQGQFTLQSVGAGQLPGRKPGHPCRRRQQQTLPQYAAAPCAAGLRRANFGPDNRAIHTISRFGASARSMLSQLAQFSILQPLSDADLQRLLQLGQVRTAPAGHLLIGENEASTAVYFLLSGEARVFITGADGREATVNTLKAGSWFGELAILGDGLRSASVIATAPSRLLSVPGPLLRGILVRYPEATERLLETLGRRIRGLTETVRGFALGDVYQRLAQLFGELAVERDGERFIPDPPPQRELAARCGASREMVARVLRELRKGGYVQTSRQRIVLKKPLPARF
ncbi:MAG: hypothetical protein OZX49_00727 [Immundisolibacter sp.]|nr:hypothetical protein [Immundisolibacter sp.]